MHRLDWFTSKYRNTDSNEVDLFDNHSLLAEACPSIIANKTIFPLGHVTVYPGL